MTPLAKDRAATVHSALGFFVSHLVPGAASATSWAQGGVVASLLPHLGGLLMSDNTHPLAALLAGHSLVLQLDEECEGKRRKKKGHLANLDRKWSGTRRGSWKKGRKWANCLSSPSSAEQSIRALSSAD